MHYMVEFLLPSQLDDSFLHLISRQRNMIEQLLSQGRLLSYSLSFEKGKIWAIFHALSEVEVKEIVSALPLTPRMRHSITPLTFHDRNYEKKFEFSLN